MNEYTSMGKGSSADVRVAGKVDKSAPKFKDGENVNKDVPKLPRVKGAE